MKGSRSLFSDVGHYPSGDSLLPRYLCCQTCTACCIYCVCDRTEAFDSFQNTCSSIWDCALCPFRLPLIRGECRTKSNPNPTVLELPHVGPRPIDKVMRPAHDDLVPLHAPKGDLPLFWFWGQSQWWVGPHSLHIASPVPPAVQVTVLY